MSLKGILKEEALGFCAVTENLFRMVDADMLNWKPQTGKNFMTTGQLLMHLSQSCGAGIKGFLTGDWGMPEGMDFADLPPDQMLPPAEKMPLVKSVDQALELLREDRELALEQLSTVDEEELLSKRFAAPWGGPEVTLFQHLMHSMEHASVHNAQLFYYLKLTGKDVNTIHLWGV